MPEGVLPTLSMVLLLLFFVFLVLGERGRFDK